MRPPKVKVKREIEKYNNVEFTAWFEDSEMNAELEIPLAACIGVKGKGICNRMDTNPGNYRCGLATQLMFICYTDDQVLGADKKGYSIQQDLLLIWERLGASTLPYEAAGHCQTVTYTECGVDLEVVPNYYPCVAYLKAASLAAFDVLFVFHKLQETMQVFQVRDAMDQFKSSPDVFIDGFGSEWFFCRCIASRKQDCLQMADR